MAGTGSLWPPNYPTNPRSILQSTPKTQPNPTKPNQTQPLESKPRVSWWNRHVANPIKTHGYQGKGRAAMMVGGGGQCNGSGGCVHLPVAASQTTGHVYLLFTTQTQIQTLTLNPQPKPNPKSNPPQPNPNPTTTRPSSARSCPASCCAAPRCSAPTTWRCPPGRWCCGGSGLMSGRLTFMRWGGRGWGLGLGVGV